MYVTQYIGPAGDLENGKAVSSFAALEAQMGATTFALTSMYLLTTLNGLNQYAGVEKAELPPGMNSQFFFNEEACNLARAKMANPLKYVCQKWKGQTAEGVAVTQPPPPAQSRPAPELKPEPQSLPQPQKSDPANIETKGPPHVRAADYLPEACEGECLKPKAEPKPKPKKVVHRQKPFDLIGQFFSMITPRDNW
jgi:hypothetical protein